jgi:Clostripain family
MFLQLILHRKPVNITIACLFCFGALFIARAGTCAETSTGISSSASAKWTIMIFLNAVNTLEPDSILNFQQMASVGSSSQVNFVVEYGRKSWIDGTAYRFRITKGMQPNKQAAIDSVPNADMGSSDTLAAFVNWSKLRYPARHYMLVIWDHGQGWRLEMLQALRARVHFRAMGGPLQATRTSTYRSISFDERSGHKLYNSDIEHVLEQQHVSLIGFDACLMSMIETGYAMRNGATVMVGSEELEPGPGWRYDSWMQPLVDTPDMDEKTLGQLLVRAYQQTYEGQDGSTTLSAVNLSGMSTLAKDVSAFADLLKADLSAELSAIKEARNETHVYGSNAYGDKTDPFQHVDLGDFCARIIEGSNNDSVRKKANVVLNDIRVSILGNSVGTERENRDANDLGRIPIAAMDRLA